MNLASYRIDIHPATKKRRGWTSLLQALNTVSRRITGSRSHVIQKPALASTLGSVDHPPHDLTQGCPVIDGGKCSQLLGDLSPNRTFRSKAPRRPSSRIGHRLVTYRGTLPRPAFRGQRSFRAPRGTETGRPAAPGDGNHAPYDRLNNLPRCPPQAPNRMLLRREKREPHGAITLPPQRPRYRKRASNSG